jgi:tetratricopeptide (TPR) repeat protein
VHITHKLLLAVLDGDLPRKVLEEIVKEHLAALCPVCREELETFDWRLYRREVAHPSLYSSHIERVARSVRATSREHRRALKEAERWLAELRKAPAEERRGKVRRAHKRFRGEVFADLLVEEARRCLPEDPWSSHSWAETAWEVQHRTPGFDKDAAVTVRTLAYRGNALRAVGRLNDADADLRAARRILEDRAITDLSVCAELDCLEGSLRKDRRQLALAETLLHRAVFLYRLLGETELRARTEIKLSIVYYDRDKSAEAVRANESALADLTPESTPRLYTYARFNLARSLENLGEHRRALALLDEDRDLRVDHLDSLTRLRATWLYGKIDWVLGRNDEADKKLTAAREGFIKAGIGYDVAMVSLELALILLEKGEMQRVQQIAREAVRIFGSQNVHPEAFASLKVFRDAALGERLTAETVRKILRHIQDVGRLPPDESKPS